MPLLKAMNVWHVKGNIMKKLLKFSAVWCGPCKALSGSLKHVNLDGIEFVEYDIDTDFDTAQAFNIRGVPTLVLLEDGVEVKRKSGVMMADEIEEFIK